MRSTALPVGLSFILPQRASFGLSDIGFSIEATTAEGNKHNQSIGCTKTCAEGNYVKNSCPIGSFNEDRNG